MATKHVAVRLDEPTLARVDALIPGLSTPHPFQGAIARSQPSRAAACDPPGGRGGTT
jgi:hypothetical protein